MAGVDNGRCEIALFWLLGKAWTAIGPRLPRSQPGARRVDDRRVISGILHVRRVGCRWCDCPTEYGPSTTIYNRFNRWSHRGFWLKLLDAPEKAGAMTKSTAIDSTCVKAQRAAFWCKKGALGAGDRSLARRLDDQGPRTHRCNRPSLRADADSLQRQRCDGRARASRIRRGLNAVSEVYLTNGRPTTSFGPAVAGLSLQAASATVHAVTSDRRSSIGAERIADL
jgi:transposase